MPDSSNIETIISRVVPQVIVGRAHLVVARGLTASDPVVLNTANTFFAMSIDAHLYSAEMYAARLYDYTRGTVTIELLLQRAAQTAGTAKCGTAAEVRSEVSKARNKIAALKLPLEKLKDRRNEWLAHTDQNTLKNPLLMAKLASEGLEDLDGVYRVSGEIVNDFSRLFLDITNVLELLDQTDYEHMLSLVADAKCAQVRRYEAEFGPAPFPRPRGCK